MTVPRPRSVSAARGALRSHLEEFVRLAKAEIGQLDRDAVKLRDRGFAQAAADLAGWRQRLERLVELADDVRREPGVAR